MYSVCGISYWPFVPVGWLTWCSRWAGRRRPGSKVLMTACPKAKERKCIATTEKQAKTEVLYWEILLNESQDSQLQRFCWRKTSYKFAVPCCFDTMKNNTNILVHHLSLLAIAHKAFIHVLTPEKEKTSSTKVCSRKKILLSTCLLLNVIILKELEWNNLCMFRSWGRSSQILTSMRQILLSQLNLQRMLSKNIEEPERLLTLYNNLYFVSSPPPFPCGGWLLPCTLPQKWSLPGVFCAVQGLLRQQLLVPWDIWNERWGHLKAEHKVLFVSAD